VDRAQVEAPSFALTLKARHVKKPRFKMHWRLSGTERGSAQFLQRAKLPLVLHTPPGDKLAGVQHAAPAWNEGRIMVPDPELFEDCEEWLYPFLDILQNFTGLGREHDDDADALGTAFDELNRAASNGGNAGRGIGAPRSV
jgi:hypothetical protein